MSNVECDSIFLKQYTNINISISQGLEPLTLQPGRSCFGLSAATPEANFFTPQTTGFLPL